MSSADMYADQVANIREKMSQLNVDEISGYDDIANDISSKFESTLSNYDDKWKSVQDAGVDDLAGLVGVKGVYQGGKKMYQGYKALKGRYAAKRKARALDEDDLDDDAEPLDESVRDAVSGNEPENSDFYNEDGQHYFTGTDEAHDRYYDEDGNLKDPTDVPEGHKGTTTQDGGDDAAEEDNALGGGDNGGGLQEAGYTEEDAARLFDPPPTQVHTGQLLGDDTGADASGSATFDGGGDDDWFDRMVENDPPEDLTSQTRTFRTNFQNAYTDPAASDDPFQRGMTGGGDEFADASDAADAPRLTMEATRLPTEAPIQPGTGATDTRPGMTEDGMDTYDAGADLGGADSLVGGGQGAVESGLTEGGESLYSRVGSKVFGNLAERGQNIKAGFQSVKDFFSGSKTAAGDVGADVGGEAAVEGGGELAGMAVGDAVLGAIPVIGEVGLAVSGLVAIGEGIYHLFHHPKKPPSPTAQPQVQAPQSLTMKYSMALPSADNSVDRAGSVGTF